MTHRRIHGMPRAVFCAHLAEEYADAGRPSIRELARRHGLAYGTTRGLLLQGGATLRPRGGANRWRRVQAA